MKRKMESESRAMEDLEKLNPLVNAPGYQVDQRDHEYVIRYDENITSDFVLASCSVPINHDFTRLEGEDHILEEK